MAIKLVIVDDHPLFRKGVTDLFSLETDIEIIGEAANGNEALKIIRKLAPDVAIIDVNLPGLNGQQVTRSVASGKLHTRVILLTAYDDIEQEIHSLRAGAAAFCTKDIDPERLVEIVRMVSQGKYVIGGDVYDASGMRRWLVQQTDGALRIYSDPGEPFHPLSNRETEVLAYLTQGLSNKEIAARLGISHQTVKNHVTSILRKLGVEDRTQAAVYALRRGWFKLYD